MVGLYFDVTFACVERAENADGQAPHLLDLVVFLDTLGHLEKAADAFEDLLREARREVTDCVAQATDEGQVN